MSSLIHRHGLVTLIPVLSCLSFAQLACAEEATPPPAQAAESGLGIGVIGSQRPYAGAAYKTIPFPLVTYENDVVRIAGVGADLKFGSAGPFRFALRARLALTDGYKPGDAPLLEGMQSRHGSLWAGPAVLWDAGDARFSFDLLGDALGKGRGIRSRLGAERDFRLGSFMVTPHLAVEWVDRKYVDYYYGVTAAEATPVRPAYAGKSTANVEAGLRTTFALDRSNIVFADIGAKALGRGITDSPLVDRKWTPGIVLGYTYRY